MDIQVLSIWTSLRIMRSSMRFLPALFEFSLNRSFCSSPSCHFFHPKQLIYPAIISSVHIRLWRVALLRVTHHWERLAVFQA